MLAALMVADAVVTSLPLPSKDLPEVPAPEMLVKEILHVFYPSCEHSLWVMEVASQARGGVMWGMLEAILCFSC